jgi:hypothetical protein
VEKAASYGEVMKQQSGGGNSIIITSYVYSSKYLGFRIVIQVTIVKLFPEDSYSGYYR